MLYIFICLIYNIYMDLDVTYICMLYVLYILYMLCIYKTYAIYMIYVYVTYIWIYIGFEIIYMSCIL